MKKQTLFVTLSLLSLVACATKGTPSLDYDKYAKEIANITNATLAKSDSFALTGNGKFLSGNVNLSVLKYDFSLAFNNVNFTNKLLAKNMRSNQATQKEIFSSVNNLNGNVHLKASAPEGELFPKGLSLDKNYEINVNSINSYIHEGNLFLDYSHSSISGESGLVNTLLNDLYPSSPEKVKEYQNLILGEKITEEEVLGKRKLDPSGENIKELDKELKNPYPSKVEEMFNDYTTEDYIYDLKRFLQKFVNEHKGNITKTVNEDNSYQYVSSLDAYTVNTLINNFTDIKQEVMLGGTIDLTLNMHQNNIISSFNITFNNVIGVYYIGVDYSKTKAFVPINFSGINGEYTVTLGEIQETIPDPGNASTYINIKEDNKF